MKLLALLLIQYTNIHHLYILPIYPLAIYTTTTDTYRQLYILINATIVCDKCDAPSNDWSIILITL